VSLFPQFLCLVGVLTFLGDDRSEEDDPNIKPSAPYVPRVSRARVMDACRVALLHEFVRELPDGYDTILSGGAGGGDEEGERDGKENGKERISLSGGQRQRLAIARAWMRDPSVLILGELHPLQMRRLELSLDVHRRSYVGSGRYLAHPRL
jgi:hypothetical protein